MPKVGRETKAFVSVGPNQVLVDLGKIVEDIQQLEYVTDSTTTSVTELRKILDEIGSDANFKFK